MSKNGIKEQFIIYVCIINFLLVHWSKSITYDRKPLRSFVQRSLVASDIGEAS